MDGGELRLGNTSNGDVAPRNVLDSCRDGICSRERKGCGLLDSLSLILSHAIPRMALSAAEISGFILPFLLPAAAFRNQSMSVRRFER